MILLVVSVVAFLYALYVVFTQPEDRLAGSAMAFVAAALFVYYFRRRKAQREERDGDRR